MYTTGKVHATAKGFLTNLAKHASTRRQVDERILYNYYLKMLSVQLVKRIGYVITSKANALTSKQPSNLHESFRQGNERAYVIGDASAD